jgi:hypothetical protein
MSVWGGGTFCAHYPTFMADRILETHTALAGPVGTHRVVSNAIKVSSQEMDSPDSMWQLTSRDIGIPCCWTEFGFSAPLKTANGATLFPNLALSSKLQRENENALKFHGDNMSLA